MTQELEDAKYIMRTDCNKIIGKQRWHVFATEKATCSNCPQFEVCKKNDDIKNKYYEDVSNGKISNGEFSNETINEEKEKKNEELMPGICIKELNLKGFTVHLGSEWDYNPKNMTFYADKVQFEITDMKHLDNFAQSKLTELEVIMLERAIYEQEEIEIGSDTFKVIQLLINYWRNNQKGEENE